MKFNLLKTKKKTEKNKEKSRGRSMVEMLGVLAIIGVLSIGGIQGYTMAMRKYRANEILSVANKYATIIWTQANQLSATQPQQYFYCSWSHCYSNISEEQAKNDLFYFSETEGYWTSDATDYIVTGNHYYSPIPFSDSGLGGLPSGIKEIAFETLSISSSGTAVGLVLVFEDQQLCETVKTMTPLGFEYAACSESYGYDSLYQTKIDSTSGYFLAIPFRQS